MKVLVDSNVLLDILTQDPVWCSWSEAAVREIVEGGSLCINPIIYCEVSIGFDRIEALDRALPMQFFERMPLPWEAAFLAGKCFLEYRRSSGERRSPLPDFYIGAHAAVERMPLLTRDAKRYRTYFPTVELITPKHL